MKRPSCLQKLVTGKPPWPRQGISFRGPSQLGQRFPTKEQEGDHTQLSHTSWLLSPCSPDCVSLDSRLAENLPGHSFIHSLHWALSPALEDPAELDISQVKGQLFWAENSSLLIYWYLKFFVEKRKKFLYFTVTTKEQGTNPYERENIATKFSLTCKWLMSDPVLRASLEDKLQWKNMK